MIGPTVDDCDVLGLRNPAGNVAAYASSPDDAYPTRIHTRYHLPSGPPKSRNWVNLATPRLQVVLSCPRLPPAHTTTAVSPGDATLEAATTCSIHSAGGSTGRESVAAFRKQMSSIV